MVVDQRSTSGTRATAPGYRPLPSGAVAAPTLSELQALAADALGHLAADGQVLAVWERRAGAAGVDARLQVLVTAVVGGRAGEATAASGGPDHLRRAARAAVLRARQARAWPAPPLPEPQAARPHDGFDAAALEATGGAERSDGLDVATEVIACRIAVASTAGVRAAEERSHAIVRAGGAAGGRRVEAVRAGVGPPDCAAAIGEALDLLAAGDGAPPPGGEGAVVLGPAAVATVLDRLRPAFGIDLALGAGPLAGRAGQAVAAPAIDLADDAHHPRTLPRAHDAEGAPRRLVRLIERGVARGGVLDSAAAARAGAPSTGHATRPAVLAPYPEHLVLAPGEAAGIAELAEGLDGGLYVPALARDEEGGLVTRGAVRIAGGRLAAGVADVRVAIDPLAILASTEALTAERQLVPLRGHCPGGAGAAVVPALRTARGLRIPG